MESLSNDISYSPVHESKLTCHHVKVMFYLLISGHLVLVLTHFGTISIDPCHFLTFPAP